MNSNDLLNKLRPWIERWQRPAWLPLTEDGDTPNADSKFGGIPWLAQGETWPACQGCQAPMPFLLQLNLEQLPTELQTAYGLGLLQLFYCTECDGGWEPFSGVNLARIVDPTLPAQVGSTPETTRSFPAKTITDWQPIIDHPSPQEHERLGLRYTYDWDSTPQRTRIEYPELGLIFDDIEAEDIAEEISKAASGDKLAGWPFWVQGVEYPSCPQCKQQMVLVFQVDSEDHIPYMFGDLGTGHITQCPLHKEIVAFGWACG